MKYRGAEDNNNNSCCKNCVLYFDISSFATIIYRLFMEKVRNINKSKYGIIIILFTFEVHLIPRGVALRRVLGPNSIKNALFFIMARVLKDVNAGAVINGHVTSNLRFADDITPLGENESDLQNIIGNFATESPKTGKAMNTDKTAVQHVGMLE